MYSIRTEGVVLKRRNINEADKLVTVLTKDKGKLQIKAPGVRKISSRRSPHIELLNRVNIALYIRHAPLLTEAQVITDYSAIKQDLQKIGFAYHICEITDGFCAENQENEAVYDLLVITLDQLCQTDQPENLVKRFEFELLDLLGFATADLHKHAHFNMHAYIESLLEKKLKSKNIFLNK